MSQTAFENIRGAQGRRRGGWSVPSRGPGSGERPLRDEIRQYRAAPILIQPACARSQSRKILGPFCGWLQRAGGQRRQIVVASRTIQGCSPALVATEIMVMPAVRATSMTLATSSNSKSLLARMTNCNSPPLRTFQFRQFSWKLVAVHSSSCECDRSRSIHFESLLIVL